MPDLYSYAASLVIGKPSDITLHDALDEGDLNKYSEIKVTYHPPNNGPPIDWEVTANPIFNGTVVNTVVLTVIPKVPPSGCLGLFLPSFPRLPKKPGLPDDPTQTGTLTGTLSPPPDSGPGDGGPIRKPKSFEIPGPAIYYGTKS
jgi:hypothetical protein